MRRLTTPEHRFTLQTDVTVIDKIRITYAQRNTVVLTKNNEDVRIEGNVAIVKLTQEDTKRFSADETVEIQVRILTEAGDALASDIIKVDCQKVLDDEVMT